MMHGAGPAEPMFVKNVAVDGSTARSALIDRGRIVDFPDRVEGNIRTFDGRGGRLISGLTDHHLHLFATVAQGWSLDLSSRDAQDAGWLADRLQDGASKGPVRGVGYSGEGETLLDRWAIDSLCSAVPVKLQYRTGGLWVLNSLALDLVLTAESEAPPAFERNDFGQLTGRVWRGDRFLRERWLTEAPDFESLGAELASWGVTSVTDASVTTDQAQVAAFEKAARRFPQRIQLMSGGCIVVPDEFTLGPVKIMLDEHALPELGVVLSKIEQARRAGRTVAAHCVTQAELALMLCAFETAGASPGDRIEHGAIITQESIAGLCALGITVVSQPAFIHSRGDRYVREIPAEDLPNLYRLRSLQNAGVKLAASSDAPYGPLNPWLAIRTATNRRSADDVEIGGCEKLAPREALDLYLSPPDDPGSAPRRPRIGEPADLCLMNGAALGEGLDPVMMTLIAGHPVYMADSMRPVSGPEAM